MSYFSTYAPAHHNGGRGPKRSELNGTESHEMNADISISESAVEPNLIFRSPPYNMCLQCGMDSFW